MSTTSNQTKIEAKGLSKYYGSFVATEDVSFTIKSGEIVAFLGPNGAGKSTTLKMLTGYLAPSKGESFINGKSALNEREEMMTSLGYLPENGPLYEDMTPNESLHFFGQARGIAKADLTKRIKEITEQLSLETVLDKPIDKLSRGFRQRVGLAQALLHDPEVLIMDEPTLGLDPNQLRTFRSHIKQLGASKTVLISTHILQEVEAIADRVILINNGKVVFDGSIDELKANDSLDDAFYRITADSKEEK